MHVRLENKESLKAQEIDLIRAYNRSKEKRLRAKATESLSRRRKGNLMAGLVAETFEIGWKSNIYLWKRNTWDKESVRNYCSDWVKLRNETAVLLCQYFTSFKRQIFI